MRAFPAAFSSDADALLRAISARVDDGMLCDIAEADYGMAVDEHLAPLRALRDRFQIPALEWHPREVLELIRWSEPDFDGWRPGGQGARGHWMRAFACAALLRSYAEHDNTKWTHAFNETLIQLTLSLERLDAGLDLEAANFVAWCIERYAEVDDGSELAFFGLTTLWFGLRSRNLNDAQIAALCQWIDAQAQHAAALGRGPAGRWLLSTVAHNQRNHAWEELGHRLLAFDLDGHDEAARDWVRLIGAMLSGESSQPS